jgi:hypothetical protein
MTLAELQAGVYEEASYQTTPAAAVITRVTRFLNEGIRVVMGEPGLSRLADSDDPLTFASVANQVRYTLPESMARIVSMRETTNDRTLDAMGLQDYRRIAPDPATSTGTPVKYVPIGKVSVATQPSNASELFVKSTAAGDTTQTAFLEGLITGGYRRTASVTLTGTTAVSLNTLITTFIEVEDFYLSATAVGTVTLLEDSGAGTELARITIGAKRPRYYGFYLWPTPAAAVTYSVDYRRELVDLVNATDEPPLPTDYHHMIVAYAVAREFEIKNDEERSKQALARFTLALSRLKFSTQSLSDELPVMGRPRRIGISRLGAWFPADTWR